MRGKACEIFHPISHPISPQGVLFARKQTNGYCEIQLILEVNESRYV